MNEEKILYVDDEEINLFIFKKLMGKKYTVITAEDGMEALEILEDQKDITLIVSDMKMPGMSGLEFIQEASTRFKNKKYYMLSGYALNEEIQEALDSGLILEYFEKPANFTKIDQAIQKSR